MGARGPPGIPRHPGLLVRARGRRVPDRRGERPVQDAELRDNPPATSDNPLESSFGLRPVYNLNRPETHGVYRDWRKIAESYSPARLLLGETWVAEPERLASYYGDHDELQLGFNFAFAFASFEPARLATIVTQTLAALPPGACPVWMGSNHDLGRFPSRWCGGDERKIRLALLVLATLPGTAVLYYGDEIGMTDVEVPVALRRDNATLDVDPGADRDRARTPMPWDGSPGGGFTSPGVTPWLPMADHPVRTVAAQRDDPIPRWAFAGGCSRSGGPNSAAASPGSRTCPPRKASGCTGSAPWWSPRTSPASQPLAGRGRRGAADHRGGRTDRYAWRPGSLGGRHHAPRAMKDQPTAVTPVVAVGLAARDEGMVSMTALPDWMDLPPSGLTAEEYDALPGGYTPPDRDR